MIVNTGRAQRTEPRARIIRGSSCWWFLGPGGTARLSERHLTAERVLRPAAESSLRAAGLLSAPAPRNYSLTVLTSTACNLGCGYCFQNTAQDLTGNGRPRRISPTRLTTATIARVMSFAAERMARAGLDGLALMLFGGEPLLNLPACRELLSRAADHGMASASMTSNGTLLTPAIAEQLYRLGLRDVQVTFDGDAATHDIIRVRRGGGGTFDAIVDNIAKASDAAPLRWLLRVNVSHYNWAGIDTLVSRLADRIEPAQCTVYFTRVGDLGIGYNNSLRHSADLAASFFRWQRSALEYGFRVPRPGADLPCQACSHRNGRYGAVVSADGTLSSCWDTAGKQAWQVGTVESGYLPPAETQGRWISCEDSYQYDDGAEAVSTFRDTVDSALLDYLDATGRL
jgi:uncharacterized protein